MNRRQFVSLTSTALLAPYLSWETLAADQVAGNSHTGLLYDDVFMDYWLDEGHPESPGRLRSVSIALEKAQLFSRAHPVTISRPPEEWIQTIHTRSHIESIRKYYPQAHKITRLVVSGVLNAVQDVCTGQIRNAFCATRPPGHHAKNTGREEGFCFYNTIAIAARFAQMEFNLGKILIVDWDYHHGNGTESAFYSDPSVLFFSTHDLFAYPGTGDPRRKGSGKGKGFNINVHLPCGTTDQMIIDAFVQQLVPVANDFKPDMILISAGFDSRRNDLLGCYDVTDKGFIELTRIVMQLADKHCDGRIVSILEGGYTLSGLASATVAHVQQLMS